MTLSTNWDEPHCPSWPGGVAVSKKGILRSNHCRHRRGGCSNSNKTFEQPPRPLLVDASRLLLMSRPPLLSRRGNGAHPNSFTASMTAACNPSNCAPWCDLLSFVHHPAITVLTRRWMPSFGGIMRQRVLAAAVICALTSFPAFAAAGKACEELKMEIAAKI